MRSSPETRHAGADCERPGDRRVDLFAEELKRIATSGENDFRRFLSVECLKNYAELDDAQTTRLQALLHAEGNQEVEILARCESALSCVLPRFAFINVGEAVVAVLVSISEVTSMIPAEAVSASFFEGQGIPVALAQIETELAKLWGPAAEQIGGPEVENPHVTRIVLANLVVECFSGDRGSLGPVLETVIARFPCRAIIVRGSNNSERRVTAEVSALCHLPAPGLPQVCSERIVLQSGQNATDLIPGAIRPLLEADLPMFLWWTGDPREHEDLFRDLADECSRLVLDLPDPGTDVGAFRLGLDPSLCECSRDSAWFGLARWRELVAQFFDPPCNPNSLQQIDGVRIESLSPAAAGPPRLAVWLVAWLAGQLGWKLARQPSNSASFSEARFTASFTSHTGDVAIEIVTRPLPAALPPIPRLSAVIMTTRTSNGPGTFRLSRPTPDSAAIHVETAAKDACCLPRVIEAPELDLARRIAAALESSRLDPPFLKALPIALELMEFK